MDDDQKDLPSRYLKMDDAVVVWDERQNDGSRLYSCFINRSWQPLRVEDIPDVLRRAVEISQQQARDIIRASEADIFVEADFV